MSSFIDKLPAIQKFLGVLTWKKIAQFSVFLFVIALAWATYENRQSIYNFASQDKLARTTKVQSISEKTKEEIDTAVNKSDSIIAIQVTLVDFQKNTRNVIHTSSDSNELKSIWGKFVDASVAELPLFNNDQVNNRRMVDLINGDFICNPYPETIGARLMPESTKYIHTVCATGIPPFYGRFTGIVSIYVKRQLTSEELDQIRTLAKTLSATIYDRDVR